MNTNDAGSQFLWNNKRMLRAVVATVAIFAILTLNVILIAQTWLIRAQASNIPDVPEYLMPGQPAPTSCEFQWRAYYPSSSYYCRTSIDGAMLFAEYGIKNGSITRVSFSVSDKTIGDLILQWGNPTGIRHFNWGVEVYWGIRTVWASTAPFSPNSEVFFIAYDPYIPSKVEPWQGFTSK